jgi:hypothetical protein
MKHSLRIDGSGGCDMTLREYLTTKHSSVRHPLGRPDKDVFFGSCATGIFDIERQD